MIFDIVTVIIDISVFIYLLVEYRTCRKFEEEVRDQLLEINNRLELAIEQLPTSEPKLSIYEHKP